MDTVKQLNALIVDDEPYIRDSMAEYFSLSGINVSLASNGKEALSFIKETQFDFIITDFSMPEMNGYELIKNIKSDFSSNVENVILMSGGSELDDLSKAILIADWFIEKPVNLEFLTTELLRN